VAFSNELFSDLVIAVELAIDYSMYIAIRIMKWLLCFRVQINDSKAIVTKS
jgi:hypothetical protein